MSLFVDAVNLAPVRPDSIICLYLYRDAQHCFSPCWTYPYYLFSLWRLICFAVFCDEITLLIQ